MLNRTMPASERVSSQKVFRFLSEYTAPVIVSAYQILAILVLAITPFLLYNQLRVSEIFVGSSTGERQLPIRILLFRAEESLNLTLSDLYTLLFITYLIGWVYLVCSIWIHQFRQANNTKSIFALFSSAAAICAASVFVPFTTGNFVQLWTVSLAVCGGALFHLALIFPNDIQLISKHPFIQWMVYIPPLILAALAAPLVNYSLNFPTITQVWIGELIYLCLATTILLLVLIFRRSKSKLPIEREKARLVIWGLILSLSPAICWIGLSRIIPGIRFHSVIILPIAIFPVMSSFALVIDRNSKRDLILNNTITYALLSGLTVISYALLVSGISLLAGKAISGNQPLLVGLLVIIIALSFNPLRFWIQNRIDTAFYRGNPKYQDRLQAFTHDLTREMDAESILHSVRQLLNETLSPTLLHIFIYDSFSNQYIAIADDSGRPTTDLRFSPDSGIVRNLINNSSQTFIREKGNLSEALKLEQSRIALLGADLYVALPGQKQLIGWLSIGPQRSGRVYSSNELSYLESLSNQAALAIERSLVIANLERRVREMDVLTRIAQGVNITLDFDDILELIYAQTNVVIPTVDFHITLLNPTDKKYYHAFYLEADERQAYNENISIPARQGLDIVVIQNQRSLITADYEQECRSQGVIPNTQDIYSWIGVPLNAGSETIGTISLGSRDPVFVFTEHHRDLLQAIADQAAGAIVKAQLLDESQKRAHQLATLNEVGRSLTSTLDINPLLTQIMNSAISILNCEAGSLFMVDPPSGELVFEVTVGPVATDLVGQRLPPGSGAVGKAAEIGLPVIANDALDIQTWFDQPDKQTSFLTRDLLAVPMKIKETTIGVIEVINKLDGSPFTIDDQEILSTFTSQAAIAIENARLYTQTDEALSARLEEMSVMQRIDRELNASLDVERTMRITLDWSMNQLNAEAGVIGFIERDDKTQQPVLQVIASKGFNLPSLTEQLREKNADLKDDSLIIDLPVIQKASHEGQPIHTIFQLTSDFSQHAQDSTKASLENLDPQGNLIKWARSQIVIPIRRKTDVIGLLLLESSHDDQFSDDSILFLTRLCDHAAIAISNALLYADLQAANIAKSEFVSLVSHELKTPMTSIRGYADLLAQGTVGPINEIQGNFLNTIRANVNRMANLVSDLADVSRIEAGKMRLEFGSVSLPEVVQEVIHSVQALIDEREDNLELLIPDNLPNVWGDYNRIIQIMNNLLSNAIKYTPQHGKIAISSEATVNDWDSQGAPQVVHITVTDTGFGISDEEQSKIFQKFFRSSDQYVRDVPGTGLGLNITRHLVEMQGGKIWFESDHGKGTSFHFTIPVAATE